MRRPSCVLAATALTLVALLGACQGITSSKSHKSSTELIPFATTAPGSDPSGSDGASQDSGTSVSDPNVILPSAIDTSPSASPPNSQAQKYKLCLAARTVVTVTNTYQKALAKAMTAALKDPTTLTKGLQALPLKDIGNAYNDLLSAVPTSYRKEVSQMQAYLLKSIAQIMGAPDLQSVSQLIAAMESDPQATKVTAATTDVSTYTEAQCKIRLAAGATPTTTAKPGG